ncbi:hypothetical protein CONLIGDRAFT_142086 [Coniochaeta ligniaria NRRL 30616]|uniref:Uncharacterized protein n=1 Tax=Coniochaeta ligniaria NRRL 30616 TaxID=1408157 RepID=A0A1J7J296_9PEZI|nr:hypothetical protein CONLIGDRAFT_142086 [Coniochaeta ligniaria NRRL 30616]
MALAMFWSPKDLTTLRELLAQPGIEERNLLMLSGDVHTAWSRGRVAFKVLASLDPQQIDLEVHLLSNLSPGQVDHSHGRDPGDAEYTSDLRHSRTGNIIKTGDVIHIRTDDINKYPLPSTPLLELQYHCQRVVRASAAADFLCVIFHDDATGPSAAAQAASDKGQEEGHTDSHAADTEPLDQAFCDMLIEEAVQHQIIAVEAVGHWRHILYQDGLEEEQLDDSQQHVRRPIPSRSSNTGSPKKWTEPEA